MMNKDSLPDGSTPSAAGGKSEPQTSKAANATAADAEQAEYMEERYSGERNSKLPARLFVIGIVVMLIVCAVYTWRQWDRASADDVTVSQAGFERIDDHLLSSSVDVTRTDPSQAAYCIVTALDYDKNEVGRREFIVPAGGEGTERFTVQIPTTEAAVAGKPYGCSTSIPSYLTYPEQ